MDAIGHIDNSLKENQNLTLKKSKSLPQVVRAKGSSVNDLSYEECVQSLLRLRMEIFGEGFTDLNESEISELTQKDSEPFLVEDIDHLFSEEFEIFQEQPTN